MNKIEFERELQSFDWLYAWSDDPRVFRESSEKLDVIFYVMNEHSRNGDESFKELYDRYNPLDVKK